jgi:peptidoglycan-associated lipoprotein
MTKSVVTSCCILLGALVTLPACHTKPPMVAPARSPAAAAVPQPPPAPPPPPKTAAAAPAALTEEDRFRQATLDQLNAERPLGDVFFDFDQSTIRDDGRQALQADARWLMRWPSTAIRIDGHCDDRGTPEYNLSLGDRRASAVRRYLEDLGVSAARIEVRSLGEEAPFCDGSGEDCWSQNRRGHFVITGK